MAQLCHPCATFVGHLASWAGIIFQYQPGGWKTGKGELPLPHHFPELGRPTQGVVFRWGTGMEQKGSGGPQQAEEVGGSREAAAAAGVAVNQNCRQGAAAMTMAYRSRCRGRGESRKPDNGGNRHTAPWIASMHGPFPTRAFPSRRAPCEALIHHPPDPRGPLMNDAISLHCASSDLPIQLIKACGSGTLMAKSNINHPSSSCLLTGKSQLLCKFGDWGASTATQVVCGFLEWPEGPGRCQTSRMPLDEALVMGRLV